MPLRESAVGHQLEPITTTFDARWVMAFAAGIPDDRPALYATDGDLVVHPLFPVAPEWELVTANRSLPNGMTLDEAKRGVHVGHDMTLRRPVPVGESLTLRASITAVGRRSAGATQETTFVATDAAGELVWETRMSSLFLGVDFEGTAAGESASASTRGDSTTVIAAIASRPSAVRLVDAHIYSECARIWNPIHTDVVAARAAGLAEPILHGTATLARAVSAVVDMAGVPLAEVRRIACRFGAMVPLGSTIEIRLLAMDGSLLRFDVLEQNGRRAISDGVIEIAGLVVA